MASAYALSPSAPALERRPSRHSLSPLPPFITPSDSTSTHNSGAASQNGSLTVPGDSSTLHFPPAGGHSHAKSPSSSYLPGLAEKLPFRTGSVDDMRKGRPRGESDLGRPSSSRGTAGGYAFPPIPDAAEMPSSRVNKEDSGHRSVTLEILTGFLLPLPFLLSSLNNPLNITPSHALHTKTEVAEEVLENVASSAVPLPQSILSLFETCALASGTLILVGLLGRMRNTGRSSKRRKSSVSVSKGPRSSASIFSFGASKKVLLRMLCVALPYLATIEIGGVKTGFIFLTAAAGGFLSPGAGSHQHSMLGSIKKAITSHKSTCMVFFLSLCYDLFWHMEGTEYSSTFRGYLAIAKSILLLPPPLPKASSALSSVSTSTGTASNASSTSNKPRRKQSLSCPLISTPEDTNLTLVAGVSIGFIAFLLSTMGAPFRFLTVTNFSLYSTSILSAAILFFSSNIASLQSKRKIGLAIGLFLCVIFGLEYEYTTSAGSLALVCLAVFAYVAAHLDSLSTPFLQDVTKARNSNHDDHGHGHKHGHDHHDHGHKTGSKFTQYLLAHTEDWPLLHSILLDKESRRIVYFMFINLGFMFIQTFYALVAGSLGLLSDSIHMFFDCMGLLAGLIASVMSKWPPNARFPYGYGKVETLSGLGNGIFLMIISVEIIWESFERFMEGAELQRLRELMVVSVGGLIVNLIGLVFIGHAHHGHDHSHGGHDHSHSHAHDHSHGHKHGHHDNLLQQSKSHDSHSHHHDHSNENMTGIYLHILADTMGSVAVIGSTILTAYTGWSGWDPIASCVIAILIIAASYPLVVGSARRLLLTIPDEVEYALRSALQEISGIRGVAGYAVPRFWLEDGEHAPEHPRHHEHEHQHHRHHHDHKHCPESDHGHHHHHHHRHDRHDHHDHHDHHDETPSGRRILGVIHIIAARGADTDDVRVRTDHFLKERNMHVLIHVDREGQGRCWCGGDKSAHKRTSSVVPGL